MASADAHRVRGGGGQQRFQGGQSGDGTRRGQQRRHVTQVEKAQVGADNDDGMVADAGDVQINSWVATVAAATATSENGTLGASAAADEHDDRDGDRHSRGEDARMRDERTDSIERGLPDLVTLRRP